jgi:signal peptidase II
VVDWLSVFAADGHVFPIFNLADSSIVVGGAIAVLLSLRGVDFVGGRNPLEDDPPPAGREPAAPHATDDPPAHA